MCEVAANPKPEHIGNRVRLEIRKTHGYVGTWAHLDKWADIGEALEIQRERISHDDESPEESTQWLVRYIVRPPKPGKVIPECLIRRALRDINTRHGCAHEYDCCGCWSYSAHSVERETGDLWRVLISGSRNY